MIKMIRVLAVVAAVGALAGCGISPTPAHFEGGPATATDAGGITLPPPERLENGHWLASCWISGISGYWVRQEMPDEPVTPGLCPNQYGYGVAPVAIYGAYMPVAPYYGVAPYAYGPMVGYAPGLYPRW